MKKIFLGIIAIALFILPFNGYAKSYNVDWKCDHKVDQGDGTFAMTCHLYVTSDFEINHVEGSLILKNVALEKVKASEDWVNNNGLNSEVKFNANTSHQNSFLVAGFLFVGNNEDTECEASFSPRVIDKVTDNYVCAIIDDQYYGKDGNIISEEKYYQECCNYTCTVVDNKYYFDSNGNSVDYNTFINDCKTINPETGFNYGYILIPIGIVSIIGIIMFVKKNTKIYKI